MPLLLQGELNDALPNVTALAFRAQVALRQRLEKVKGWYTSGKE